MRLLFFCGPTKLDFSYLFGVTHFEWKHPCKMRFFSDIAKILISCSVVNISVGILKVQTKVIQLLFINLIKNTCFLKIYDKTEIQPHDLFYHKSLPKHFLPKLSINLSVMKFIIVAKFYIQPFLKKETSLKFKFGVKSDNELCVLQRCLYLKCVTLYVYVNM